MLSLTVRGTPSSRPSDARSSHRFALASAAERADFRFSETTALILGLTSSRRSSTESKASTGENSRLAYPETRSIADFCQRRFEESGVGMLKAKSGILNRRFHRFWGEGGLGTDFDVPGLTACKRIGFQICKLVYLGSVSFFVFPIRRVRWRRSARRRDRIGVRFRRRQK